MLNINYYYNLRKKAKQNEIIFFNLNDLSIFYINVLMQNWVNILNIDFSIFTYYERNGKYFEDLSQYEDKKELV